MTQDDILRIAREADVWVAGQKPYQTQLERFAALVAEAEREACAEMVAGMDVQHPKHIAEAIRARGEI